MGSLMPGSFPSDDVPLSTVMGPVGGNTPINAYESLQLVNNRRFTNKHWVNERIRNQKQLILCLDTLVYVIVGYQFIKFSYSAALFPVVMHIVAQRLISVDTYLQNSHGGNLRTGVIGVILMIANTEGVAGSRRNSRRSSRRGSPEPERRRERERGGGMRVINVNLPRAGSNRSPEPTENTASSSTAPTTNNSVMVTEDAKRAYLNLLVKRICAFIYWKFIIVSIYHIIFISFWLMPFAMSDEIQKFQFGVWWFISFIGETPPLMFSQKQASSKEQFYLDYPG